MQKEETKVDFDLSALTLEELIDVYQKIAEFLDNLKDSKIIQEEMVEDE